MNVQPLKQPLGEAMNEFKLIEAVKKLIERVDTLEYRIIKLEGGERSSKPKRELTQIGKFEPYIHQVLANGKIWSTHGIEEEIKTNHPELPVFNQLGIQNACGRLAKKGIIEKVANKTYRKKM